MLSIARHLDSFDIAQEVRLERKVHKGSFLFLEGTTDIKRFTPFVDNIECSIVNSWGRKKAIEAVDMLSDEGFPGVLACVDADFDRQLAQIIDYENVLYSSCHDFDLDWAQTSAMQKYLDEVAEPAKMVNFPGGSAEIRDKIVTGLRPISIARLLNRKGSISEKLSDIDCSCCFSNFSVDVDNYVQAVREARSLSPSRTSVIRTLILSGLSESYDLEQITNGHDFHCALGASLRLDLANRREVHTWASEVEMHIRLAFSDSELKKTAIFKHIRAWEVKNRPYMILDSRLYR